jgi:hypothetical protein
MQHQCPLSRAQCARASSAASVDRARPHPSSYFYDPAADPVRERGELLRCLMPRAGKRRDTMEYKQYYWASVIVGRGRTKRWDVDWEEGARVCVCLPVTVGQVIVVF